MQSILIRVLGEEDHKTFAAAVKMFRQVEVSDPARFLADPATIAVTALAGSEVIGWAWGNRQQHVAGYSQVQLYEIEVIASWRNRGVGRALLTRFLELTAHEGHQMARHR